MIVIDSSVWADHFHASDPHLFFLWSQGSILQHPLVTGELAMGNLRDWKNAVRSLRSLPQAQRLSEGQVLDFVEEQRLMGTGIGFIDANILASVVHQTATLLWTRDKRLLGHAERLGIAYDGA